MVCFVAAFYFLKRRDEEAARKEREKALAAAAKNEEKVIEKPYSLKELREYDGTDESKPLLLAVNYKVFDVTKGKDFYGKGEFFYFILFDLALRVCGFFRWELRSVGWS